MTVLCLDVGSTWTKGTLVSHDGELLGTAQHPTTTPEVMHGISEVLSGLPAAERVVACSSAGGGLRLAVVGHERLVSAEAGYRVALSAGARVVHVSSGKLRGVKELRATRPDLVLLVGGTDGGDEDVLLHNARRLAVARIACPVVLAGNADARAEAESLLSGRIVVSTGNVLPDVGVLDPEPARRAIRDLFLRHVIGGKGLSRGNRFRRMVRAVTPDAVLSGVSHLAALQTDGAVLVVDVGGATTDVYSAVRASDGAERTVALPPDRRTVEGDLGLRRSAPGVVEAALADRLLTPEEAEFLAREAEFRAAHPSWLPEDPEVDRRLAALAIVVAVRRHLAYVGSLGPHGARLVVLSGGVFRHAPSTEVFEDALREDPALRPVVRAATVVVDRHHVLAPAGLLAGPVAAGLLGSLVR
ncbi:methylaspartate mutase accessory protein GlmL [Saccharothrix violaceirubra]|uniref:Uncharacterized protein (TIGR01319 family) n=1 Tax=Saccharothrix violaceirubra TaxID=413306 RepID=A0A7W7SYE5_9PSEU|nr:glutamate mutase L [Saccharothrix violaceirubra]MBB4963188.1 uncharacterized protein (TIGR01319 family) [Saccharothrix violaceirubra]